MQVYASYRYRRDLVEAAKVPGALIHTRLFTVRRPHLRTPPALHSVSLLPWRGRFWRRVNVGIRDWVYEKQKDM